MSAIREARDRGDDRSRSRGRGRGSMLQYYDDIGMSTTEQGYSDFKELQASGERQRASQRQQINQAQNALNQERQAYQGRQNEYRAAESRYNQQREKIDQYRQMLDPSNMDNFVRDAWRRASRSPDAVIARVTTADGNVQGSYVISRQQAELLNRQLNNSGFVPNSRFFNVGVRQHGRMRGGEMHQILGAAQQGQKTSVMQEAQRMFASQSADARGNIRRAEEELGTFKSQLDAAKLGLVRDQGLIDREQGVIRLAREHIAGLEQQEQQFLVDLQENYNDKIGAMRRVLGTASTTAGEASGDAQSIYEQVKEGGPSMTEQVIAASETGLTPDQVAELQAEQEA